MNNQVLTPDTKVMYAGKKDQIVTSKKNFSSGEIFYKLLDGSWIPADDSALKPFKESLDSALKPFKESPVQSVSKEPEKVPVKTSAMKSIKKKSLKKEDPYQALARLTKLQLGDFIAEKKLEIDPDDYVDQKELLKAVCEELNIPMSK